MNDHDLRYPIGEFVVPQKITQSQISGYITRIEKLPLKVKAAVAGLSDQQLDTPYRPQGWTIRQVIHHLPDSHMNAVIRFKLALTEDNPQIRPYFEARWALLPDYQNTPVTVSLDLLENLHNRWVVLLNSLQTHDLSRTFVHPEYNTTYRLDETIANYAWHGDHHLAHIEKLKKRKGW